MGRVNYGPYMFDRKLFWFIVLLHGILSSVYLNGKPIHEWKMLSVPFQKIPEIQKINPTFQNAPSDYNKLSSHKRPIIKIDSSLEEPAFYIGREGGDSSFPVILELESPNPDLVLSSFDHLDLTCGSRSSKVHQL
ncbi:hypothetical protein POM88_051721 [Heracleum sosnowskyi]|uniref:Uncharacterized protein n=1 Tax=Heracleum sosnowskyi TaxID=360622 RepID=A0AAD8H2I2_9APIA|nr:hypothetical protein POM88_051721 [Heracleum sosnowskyi]